jgi:hypothetical protein
MCFTLLERELAMREGAPDFWELLRDSTFTEHETAEDFLAAEALAGCGGRVPATTCGCGQNERHCYEYSERCEAPEPLLLCHEKLLMDDVRIATVELFLGPCGARHV